MEYYGIMPKRKLWVKVGVIIFGLYTIYSSVINHNLFYLPFGIVMLLAVFSDRKHMVSQEGVDIVYTVCGFQFHNMWSWNEIDAIHTNSFASKPNIELHIAKGVITRRFILTRNDADGVLAVAKKFKIYTAEIERK